MSGLSLAGTGLTITGGSGTTALEIGTTTIIGGTTGRVLYDNGGVLGETTIASGLFGYKLSGTVPTTASTGLNTWVNQDGATVADTAAGVTISAASPNLKQFCGRVKAAPTAPYTITTLQTLTVYNVDYSYNALGFYDGTNKMQFISIIPLPTGGPTLYVQGWNTPTTYTTNFFSGAGAFSQQAWFQISDDGTSVYFRYSNDGVNFMTAYSETKASGFLGASGYSNVGFFLGRNTSGTPTPMSLTLMDWVVT